MDATASCPVYSFWSRQLMSAHMPRWLMWSPEDPIPTYLSLLLCATLSADARGRAEQPAQQPMLRDGDSRLLPSMPTHCTSLPCTWPKHVHTLSSAEPAHSTTTVVSTSFLSSVFYWLHRKWPENTGFSAVSRPGSWALQSRGEGRGIGFLPLVSGKALTWLSCTRNYILSKHLPFLLSFKTCQPMCTH